MIHGRRAPLHGARKNTKSERGFRDRLFAWKFQLGLTVGLAVCLLLFLVPTVFFVEQNYEIFTRLAYDVNPGLVQHMDREVVWLRAFLVGGLACTLLVGFFFTKRLIRHLMLPLEKVEDHLKSLTRGEWHQNGPELPIGETYRGLFLTYDYFHRHLRAQAENELRLLEKLSVDPTDREALLAWKGLLNAHRTRLGLESADTPKSSASDASPSEVATLRRVS